MAFGYYGIAVYSDVGYQVSFEGKVSPSGDLIRGLQKSNDGYSSVAMWVPYREPTEPRALATRIAGEYFIRLNEVISGGGEFQNERIYFLRIDEEGGASSEKDLRVFFPDYTMSLKGDDFSWGPLPATDPGDVIAMDLDGYDFVLMTASGGKYRFDIFRR